jgi:hypothetical protein
MTDYVAGTWGVDELLSGTVAAMGLITDFYVAPRSAAQAILDGAQAQSFEVLQAKALDPVKLETLEEILIETLGTQGPPGETVMLTDEAAEAWVLLVSPSLVTLLAQAMGVVADVAARWAKTDEIDADESELPDVQSTVESLCAMAGKATAAKSDLLLHMSL